MTFLLRGIIITALAIPFNSTLPSNAKAGGCNCTYIGDRHRETRNVIRQENKRVREQVKSSIEQQTTDLNAHLDTKTKELIEALKGHARENTNHQKMQTEAAGRVQDAAEINAANRLRDEFRAAAESGLFDPSPSSCRLLDLYRTNPGAFSPNSNGSSVVTEAQEWTRGNNPSIVTGGAALGKHVADNQKKYENYGNGTSSDPTSDFAVLFDGDPTINFNDPETAEIATIIVQNGLDSAPQRPRTEEELLTPAGLDQNIADVQRNTRLSAANESIKMVLNMNSAVMSGPTVEEYRKRANESAYNRGTDFQELSELQQIDINTVWHYAPRGERLAILTGTPGSDSKVKPMNEKAWLAEIHAINSLNARINYLQLELDSRDALVNAYILARLVDNN